MRISFAILVLVGCDKGVPPSPPPVPVPVVPIDAGIDAIDAPPPLEKLVEKTPALGLRAGAWMDIDYLDGAELQELRVTAPRVVKLALQTGEETPAIVTLDPSSKDAQVIPFRATNHLRIAIAELKAGGRGRVAKIELWGRWSPAHRGGEPIVKVSDDRTGFCPNLDKRIEEVRARVERDFKNCDGPGCDDYPGGPSCDTSAFDLDLPEPWRDATRFCSVDDINLGTATCEVTVSTADASLLAVFPFEKGGPSFFDIDPQVEENGDLVFKYSSEWRVDTQTTTVVCRANPLGCSNR